MRSDGPGGPKRKDKWSLEAPRRADRTLYMVGVGVAARQRRAPASLAVSLSFAIVIGLLSTCCDCGSNTRGGACSGGGCVELRPRQPLEREKVPIGGGDDDGGGRRYKLVGVEPGTPYEVRISYPATNPAEVQLEVVALGERPSGGRIRAGIRRLLNVEKLILQPSQLVGSNAQSRIRVVHIYCALLHGGCTTIENGP